MDKKNIFIDPHTFVTVHIMGNDYEPRNKNGWRHSAVRPISYSFFANNSGPVFHDPGLDIRLDRGGKEYTMVAPRTNKDIRDIIKDCIDSPKGVVPDSVYDSFPGIIF